MAAYEASLLTQGAAQKELKALADETGLFDSITDEEIEANKDKSYSEVTAMSDPLAGLMGGADEDSPFSTQDSLTVDENDRHDPIDGRFDEKPDKLWPDGKVLTYVECRAILDSLPKGFSAPAHWNETNLKKHFGPGEEDDHSDMYPGWDINNYQNWSCCILDHEPDGIVLLGATIGNYRYRYCIATNDFVKENATSGVVTMFKPSGRRAYYESQIRE